MLINFSLFPFFSRSVTNNPNVPCHLHVLRPTPSKYLLSNRPDEPPEPINLPIDINHHLNQPELHPLSNSIKKRPSHIHHTHSTYILFVIQIHQTTIDQPSSSHDHLLSPNCDPQKLSLSSFHFTFICRPNYHYLKLTTTVSLHRLRQLCWTTIRSNAWPDTILIIKHTCHHCYSQSPRYSADRHLNPTPLLRLTFARFV